MRTERVIKKSHKWHTREVLQVRCPCCRQVTDEDVFCASVGDAIKCSFCGRIFELGRQT